MGFIAPAIGANQSKKLTGLLSVTTQYLWQSLNEQQHAWLHTQQVTSPKKYYVNKGQMGLSSIATLLL